MSCAEKEDAKQAKLMELRASSDIEIEILVPNENFVPRGVLRRAGTFVMQRVVDIGLPQVNPLDSCTTLTCFSFHTGCKVCLHR